MMIKNVKCAGLNINIATAFFKTQTLKDDLIEYTLLDDVFDNFRNMCLEIYELYPAYFLTPELAWKAALKKTKVKLDLLTDTNMLLMVKKGIRGGICRSVYRYAKANNKYTKDYDKNKWLPNLQYWEEKVYMDGQCHKIFQ